MMKRFLMMAVTAVTLGGALSGCGNASAPAASAANNNAAPAADPNKGAAAGADAQGAGAESAGTGAQGTGAEAVEIRLLTRMSGAHLQVQIYNEVIEEFKALHPEVTIVDDSQGDEAAFNNILKTDLASGTMANIFRIQGVSNLGKYIDEGYLLNVEPYLKEDAEWGGGFVEGALNYYRVPGRDGIYGVPCEGGLIGVYYNTQLFEQAGITEFPQTWTAFKEAAAKLKEKGIKPLALGAKSSYMAGHLHNQIFYKWMGTEAAKALGERTLKYTDPEVVKTFGFVKELYDLGVIDEGTAGLSDELVMTDFLIGNTAMMITGPWNVTRFRNLDESLVSDYIELAKFPYFEEKPEFKDNDMQVISPYMINGKLEGRELELTVELVKMLTSKETATRMAVEAGQYIPRSDIDLAGTEVDPLFAKTIELCATSTGVAVDVFDYDPVSSMQDRTRNSIVSLFTGAAPEEAAAEIQAEIDSN